MILITALLMRADPAKITSFEVHDRDRYRYVGTIGIGIGTYM